MAGDPGGRNVIFLDVQPSGPPAPPATLAVFDGEDAQGIWNLAVWDLAEGETGRLLGWCLEFGDEIFVDGFESGTTGEWSSATP